MPDHCPHCRSLLPLRKGRDVEFWITVVPPCVFLLGIGAAFGPAGVVVAIALSVAIVVIASRRMPLRELRGCHECRGKR